ncbi:MAG: AAA family ATPase [Clostridia bacterium]|nr:AAA family ATPase [Clostridia bacterium]
MDNFLKYFFQDMGNIFRSLVNVIVALGDFLNHLLNFPMRMDLIKQYEPSFSTVDWILLLIVNLLLIALIVFMIIGLVKLFKKIFRFRISPKKYDEMVAQVRRLQRELIRANYEKDKLLAMRVAELSGDKSGLEDLDLPEEEKTEEPATEGDGDGDAFIINGNRNRFDSPCIDPSDSRFFRLTSVDNFYKTEYQPPVYDNEVTLEEFCIRFRKFAASRLHLYYDLDMMRYFVASLGTARIIILQGISGTGKTSLPYAFGKFVQKDTTVVSVQPSWRERTELYGYYNEFTKKYSETEFLRAIYEGNYYRDPHIVILDEMNIARVEYYFAEMLSILEMPRQEEWKVDIVTAVWDNDPCLIDAGTVQITNNIWFVGTINNDDSTFAVADKVYDRAIPIDLDSRADAFECEDTPPIYISTDHLNALFDQAKRDYPISQEMLDKLDEVNAYVIKAFRLAFGNRIMKQIRDYVPCFIACGGTELQAVDFIVAKKVLRKFESLSLGFMKDELTKFSNYLDRMFGKNTMVICKQYIEYLKKNN